MGCIFYTSEQHKADPCSTLFFTDVVLQADRNSHLNQKALLWFALCRTAPDGAFSVNLLSYFLHAVVLPSRAACLSILLFGYLLCGFSDGLLSLLSTIKKRILSIPFREEKCFLWYLSGARQCLHDMESINCSDLTTKQTV